jgi:glycosyltransferase involved in cell wall biosynthesis
MDINRILIVYHGFRTRGAGLRRHILQLCRELERRSIEAQVLSLEELPFIARYAPPLLQRVGNALWAPSGDYARYMVTRTLLGKTVRRRIRHHRRTAVVFEDIYTATPVDVPWLTVAHALQSDNVYQHSLTEGALRRARAWDREVVMALKGPAVTVSQEYHRHIGRALGVEAATRFGIIPLGIDLEEFPQTLEARPADVFNLAYLGRFEARKNLAFLLDVMPRVVAAGCARARLTLIGEGPLRRELEDGAQRRGLQHVVRFDGPLPPAKVPAALQRHHMYLHPSLRESFSYSLLEAKVSGLRTVATPDVEVPRDFVDEALPLNAEAWAGVVVSAYKTWERGSFRLPSRESLAGLRRRYGIQSMVDGYLSILSSSDNGLDTNGFLGRHHARESRERTQTADE